jgi:hypothetical protein
LAGEVEFGIRRGSVDENLVSWLIPVSPERLSASTYSLVIDDLGNGGEAACVRSFVDEDDAADLDESPVGGRNRSFAHFQDLRRNY